MKTRESHESLANDNSLFSKLIPIFVHFSTVILTTPAIHALFCDFSQKPKVHYLLYLFCGTMYWNVYTRKNKLRDVWVIGLLL